jgi:hypothetical protein
MSVEFLETKFLAYLAAGVDGDSRLRWLPLPAVLLLGFAPLPINDHIKANGGRPALFLRAFIESDIPPPVEAARYVATIRNRYPALYGWCTTDRSAAAPWWSMNFDPAPK